ncbi:MAG: amidohydrolase family protein, partial [Candidatus Limnocylindria bacterium]
HVLRLLRDWAGAAQMAMGSDYPHKLGDISRAVTTIDAMEVSPAERDRIFSGTARAILNNG